MTRLVGRVEDDALRAAARSVACIPLLFPWVTVVVVAVALPESGLIVRAQLDPANPLRTLPEVVARDEQPRRATVLRGERLVLILIRDPRLAAAHVGERQVGRVPAVTEREDVRGTRVDAVQQRVE